MMKSSDSVVKISDQNSGIELELELRPVAIDCANLASFYDYCRPVGSAIGPLEAYHYFKSKGHETKVFTHQFRLSNKRKEKIMRDVVWSVNIMVAFLICGIIWVLYYIFTYDQKYTS